MSFAYPVPAVPFRLSAVKWWAWAYFGLLAALAVTSAYTLAFRHKLAVDKLHADARNLSFILSDHFSRSIGAIDRSLESLSHQVQGADSAMPGKIEQLLVVSKAGLADVTRLSVLDASGRIIFSTAEEVVGKDRSNTFLFQLAASTPGQALIVDMPFSDALEARRMLPLVRRIEGPNGEFRGVIAAIMNPGSLLNFYRTVDLGSGGCLWLSNPSARLIILEPTNANPDCAQKSGGDAAGYVRETRLTGPLLEVGIGLPRAPVMAQLRHEIGLATVLLLALATGGAVALLFHRRLVSVRRSARKKVAEAGVALRRSTEENRHLFETTPDLIFVSDAEGRFVRISPSGAALLGLPSEQIIGRKISEFVHPDDLARVREVTQRTRMGEELRSFEMRCIRPDGSAVTLSWSGVWSETEQKFFMIGRDQTELKKRQEELAAQNVILDAALGTMTQGLAMFDKDQNLVFANEKFATMYGQSMEDVKPGTNLRAIIEHRIRSGHYFNTTADEILERMRTRVARGRTSYMTARMGDGRTITVSIEPRPDGGWVTTHQDITEREKLKERLDAAISNMTQGLALFDANQRLILCNARYGGIYGLSEDECKPGMALRDILQTRVAKGAYAVRDTDSLVQLNVATFADEVSEVLRLADGRSISVVRRPLPSGGVISTHEDITERQQMEARLAHLAHHDALTELPNRVSLEEHVRRLLSAGLVSKQIAVMCVDLDRFKEVNDSLGHAAGDALLKSVAQRLQGCVRDSDFVARLGGDEFAIVISSSDPTSDAALLAQRVVDRLSATHSLLGHEINTGASLGIAIAPYDGDTLDQLLRNADLALYSAKGEGRGTYRFYSASMSAPVRERRALELELRSALDLGQLSLAYQPLFDVATRTICGFEALLRWNHPERGMISPADFIPIAESTGLIVRIGEWVLREACSTAVTWPSQYKIAVNLSPLQVKSPNCTKTVTSALARSGLDARRLEIEITESVLLSDDDGTLTVLRQLHALGVSIALDDFGTGYSSLSYLRRFPFSKIKIDRSFTKDIKEAGSLAILRTIAELGATLGMITTAEGIETEEQLAIVGAYGCLEAQGYLLGRPIPRDEIAALIEQPAANAA